MNRVKTFDSTGVAPNGKLFAGDLNAIEDAAAALTDFAQNISVASLLVGDGSLSLAKFGAGEGSFSGAFRVSGLLRGLGGIIAGTFTTAQRDAIALSVGLAPYGTIILNSSTNRYEANYGTDAARNWQPIGIVQGDVDKVGTSAARLASATLPAGTLWFESDTGRVYRTDGLGNAAGNWTLFSARAGTELASAVTTGLAVQVDNTEAAAAVVITLPSITFDGATAIMLDAQITNASRTGDNTLFFAFFDGTTSLGALTQGANTPPDFYRFGHRLVPTVGAHTYSIRFWGDVNTTTGRAGGGVGGAGAKQPAYLRASIAV